MNIIKTMELKFEKLTANKDACTFAYWILIELKKLPQECLDPDYFHSWMSYHYDSEEQTMTPEGFWSYPEWMPNYVRPLAPVTLAKRWAPFEMALELLGPADYLKCSSKKSKMVVGIWSPRDFTDAQFNLNLPDVRHFWFLLNLCLEFANQEGGRIIVVGEPGWWYDGWLENRKMMNPRTALLMHKAGYLYLDRVPQ